MPIYAYECEAGHEFDLRQGFHDEPTAVCPTCEASARRRFHPATVIYKGYGLYTTEYARNSIFSSLLPIELSKIEKDLWVGEGNNLSGKNNNEYDLLKRNLKRQNIDIKFSYSKIINHDDLRNIENCTVLIRAHGEPPETYNICLLYTSDAADE